MDEHYHSKHGAIAESQHIFIQNGLLAKKELKSIMVFEVGMGTGLNVMTSIQAADENNLSVEYDTVEAFPVKETEIKDLNFVEELQFDPSLFQKIHQGEWCKLLPLQENFRLQKQHQKLLHELVFVCKTLFRNLFPYWEFSF